MYKTHSRRPYFRYSIAVSLSVLLISFSLAGCGTSAATIVRPTPTAFGEIITEYPTPKVDTSPTPIVESVTESAPHVSPYIDVMVTSVDIRYLQTNPEQIELVIQGTLPDQCKYNFYSIENRNGQTIKVSLDGIHPADTSCLQTEQIIEYVLPLGRDMPESERGFAPGEYELKVNNYQTTFTVK